MLISWGTPGRGGGGGGGGGGEMGVSPPPPPCASSSGRLWSRCFLCKMVVYFAIRQLGPGGTRLPTLLKKTGPRGVRFEGCYSPRSVMATH